jgi:restriction system protein
MGYYARVLPPHIGSGVDIIAHKDELGFEPPIIKVQVKSSFENITPEKVHGLYGNVKPGEYGLFITLGSFSTKAREFATNQSNFRLIDGKELIDLIFKYYDELDSEDRRLIPLKRIFVPDVEDKNED